MKILVCWPPHVPSYFNAGHHLPVFSTAAFLRSKGHTVTAVDCGALSHTWKDFADLLTRSHETPLIVVINEYDVVEGLRRAFDYIRALSPQSTIATVGRLGYQCPGFLRNMSPDAVGESGDYEAAAEEVVRWVEAGRPATPLKGVSIRLGERWMLPAGSGDFLPPQQWVFPNPEEIPYASHDAMYQDDGRKFCGIPSCRELVVPAARGCPIGCEYCDVTPMQGRRDRRVSVRRVLEYIKTSFARNPFEYVAFYAPTFTLDRRWVVELCEAFVAEGSSYPWKCATTLHHLDADLLSRMGQAGCIRVSVGVETLETPAALRLPSVKQRPLDQLEQVVGWCKASGIELNCFVVLGLPGSTPAGARETLRALHSLGVRARPTIYTPYHEIHAQMTEQEVSRYNRQLLVPSLEAQLAPEDRAELYRIAFGADEYVTTAPKRVSETLRAHVSEPGD